MKSLDSYPSDRQPVSRQTVVFRKRTLFSKSFIFLQ